MGNIKRTKVLKAIILEYENGWCDILYECDKSKNAECNKKNCDKEYCNHTLDKQYAKNYESENKTTRNVVAPVEKIKELILANHPRYKNLKLKDKKTIVNHFAYFEDDTELLDFLEYMDED